MEGWARKTLVIRPLVAVGPFCLGSKFQPSEFGFVLEKAEKQNDGVWEDWVSRSPLVTITMVDGVCISFSTAEARVSLAGKLLLGMKMADLCVLLKNLDIVYGVDDYGSGAASVYAENAGISIFISGGVVVDVHVLAPDETDVVDT